MTVCPLNCARRISERITIDGRLITGGNSLLGKTVLISEGTDVACGTIEAAGEKKIVGAKFEGKFKGRIKMVQTLTAPQGLPTEVVYYFEQGDEIITHRREDESQCGSHVEFCPIGDLSKRSSLLELNIRRQLIINDLALSGPLSVSHRWIRVRPANDVSRSECAPVEEWYEETFRWTALSSRTLSQLQNELAERFGVEPFQVAVYYNRELIGSRCSIYRITLTASKEVQASGLSLFNREERRFYSDEELRCSNDTAAAHLSSSTNRGFDIFAIAYRLLIFASAVLFLRNL
uniref:MAM domain-containing protein n=1 Tax=Ascaris lumbricoides TaxID=6252 RepID=A0A0M3IBK8_ASCLU